MSFFRFLLLFALANNLFAKFTSVDEASILLASGNSDMKTYAIKTDNSYKLNSNIFSGKGSYTYGESQEVRTTEKWDFELKLEHMLNEKVSLFVAEILESNRFAGFSRRYNTDAGFKYSFLKTDLSHVFVETGYRYSVEKSVSNMIADKKDSKGRIYLETFKKFNDSLSGKFWVEYIPNFSESEDYLINFEPSLSVVLTSTFSLKMAYLWKYDHLPVIGSKSHDTTYTTSIIAQF